MFGEVVVSFIEGIDRRQIQLLPACLNDYVASDSLVRISEASRGRRADGSDYNYAPFRDGLALVGDPFRPRKFETRRWSPKEGFEG